MNKKPSRLGTLLFLIASGGLCLAVFLAANFIAELPTKVEAVFGPASPTLTTREKYSLAFQLWLQEDALLTPANPNGYPELFNIGIDEPTSAIIERLQAAGIIKDANVFRNYLIFTGLDNQIQAGDYQLSAAMAPIQIAKEILDATPDFVILTILPGWRLEEVAETLPSSGLAISIEDFIRAAHNPPLGYIFSGQIPAGFSVEGFLMPGSYELPRELSAEELVIVLLNRFEERVSTEVRDGLFKQGLSLREGVIIASIVEREAVVAEEQSLIASVFLNRLTIGMSLEADPTVQYAAGYNPSQLTWWTNPLSTADLGFNSPYNTYIYGGIPPGPIANPSLDALIAVAFPTQTSYYFFRAACDDSGRHNFAETFEQHQANECS
ncbi:MAG: endolytic transglycosylase MltG [Chloroflexi bacterium]|nr:endolytic transglycosylase MltG [Chloroflexota bacterium]